VPAGRAAISAPIPATGVPSIGRIAVQEIDAHPPWASAVIGAGRALNELT